MKSIKKSAAKNFVLETLPIVPGLKDKAYNKDINDLINE